MAQQTRSRSGWLTFAGVMFLFAGALNLLWGIAALANDDYFRADELLFGDLSVWGGVYLGFGVVQLGLGALILGQKGFGIIAGSLIALLHAIVVMVSIGAYPLWSTVVLAIDALIVYGLVVHGTPEPAQYEPTGRGF
jgi:hypothetical protein